MAKQKKENNNLNQIKPLTNVIFNIIFLVLGLACITPVVLVFIISITKESTLVSNGYSFFPEALSLTAYSYLWNERKSIGNDTWSYTYDDHGICIIQKPVQAQGLFQLDGIYTDDF